MLGYVTEDGGIQEMQGLFCLAALFVGDGNAFPRLPAVFGIKGISLVS